MVKHAFIDITPEEDGETYEVMIEQIYELESYGEDADGRRGQLQYTPVCWNIVDITPLPTKNNQEKIKLAVETMMQTNKIDFEKFD